MNTNATTYIRYAEPTVRSNASQAYSQCSPEPEYDYSTGPNYGYGSYYGQPAPMQQQPVPVQVPVARSSSSGKGLLVVAGLAVVGAAAFGGVYLMNSSNSQPAPTAVTSAVPAAAPAVNLPQIQVAAPAPNGPASVPVIVNNPAPVIRTGGPAVASRSIAAPQPITAPKQVAAPAPAPAPAPASAPAPAPAPAQPNGPGVSIETPFSDVNVGSKGNVSVDTPVVGIGVPGQDGGNVEVKVPGPDTKDDKTPANANAASGDAQNNGPQDGK